MAPIPHKKLILLQEPGVSKEESAELTFWFELYHGMDKNRPTFMARLININEGKLNRQPINSVDLIAQFQEPEKFILNTIQEFISRVEKNPAEFIDQSRPVPPGAALLELEIDPRPWLFRT